MGGEDGKRDMGHATPDMRSRQGGPGRHPQDKVIWTRTRAWACMGHTEQERAAREEGRGSSKVMSARTRTPGIGQGTGAAAGGGTHS